MITQPKPAPNAHDGSGLYCPLVHSSVIHQYNRVRAACCKHWTCNRAAYSGRATWATCIGGSWASEWRRGFRGVDPGGWAELADLDEVGGGRVERPYMTEPEGVRGSFGNFVRGGLQPLGRPVRVEVTAQHPYPLSGDIK